MDIIDRETAKNLLANYVRNTESESEVVEGLSRILTDGRDIDLEKARQAVRQALDETVEEIIVDHVYTDGSHPSVDAAIEMCLESHAKDFVENILKKLERAR